MIHYVNHPYNLLISLRKKSVRFIMCSLHDVHKVIAYRPDYVRMTTGEPLDESGLNLVWTLQTRGLH